MHDERRKNYRYPLKLQVYWERPAGGKQLVEIADISVGGCFVKSASEVPIGTTVHLEMRLPTGQWLLLDGKVAHNKPGNGFGVQFSTDLENSLLESINPTRAKQPF